MLRCICKKYSETRLRTSWMVEEEEVVMKIEQSFLYRSRTFFGLEGVLNFAWENIQTHRSIFLFSDTSWHWTMLKDLRALLQHGYTLVQLCQAEDFSWFRPSGCQLPTPLVENCVFGGCNSWVGWVEVSPGFERQDFCLSVGKIPPPKLCQVTPNSFMAILLA